MSMFDRTFARLLLEICRYTYSAAFKQGEEVDLKNALDWINGNTNPMPRLILLQDDDELPTSVACVAVFPDKNIVSYMGTKTNFDNPPNALASLKDWLENLEAKPVAFQLTKEQLGADIPNKNDLGGKVHKGFLDQLSKIQEKVINTLDNNGGKTKQLFVTGHSQGGAEAALATRAFLAGGYLLMASYTFAAPRPGDAAFTQSIPASFPLHRIEFGNDIVPHVPPRTLSQNVKSIVDAALSMPFLGEKEKESLLYLETFGASSSFSGAGKLCYGDHETQTVRLDMSQADEDSLFNSRLKRLLMNPKHWGDHHHLAGTNEEVENGKKGNYTALVSDYTES